MNAYKREKKKINRLYRRPKENIYSYSLFRDLSLSYSFKLADKSKSQDFYDFEPHNCILKEYLMKDSFHDFNSFFDGLIGGVINSLVIYGRAYLYIDPHFKVTLNEKNEKEEELQSISLHGLMGYVKKKSSKDLLFYTLTYDKNVQEIQMPISQLISFDLRDVGYDRKYFTSLEKKLGKVDIVSSMEMMNNERILGYDFSLHKASSKLKELKLVKEIGWSFNTDELSDSYILYKEIKMLKMRIKILKYVIGQINDGLTKFIPCVDCGKIVANIKVTDYEKIWNDFSDGRITTKELTDILYD